MKLLERDNTILLLHKHPAFAVPGGRHGVGGSTLVQFGFQSQQQRGSLLEFEALLHGTIGIVAREYKRIIGAGHGKYRILDGRVLLLYPVADAKLGQHVTQVQRAR